MGIINREFWIAISTSFTLFMPLMLSNLAFAATFTGTNSSDAIVGTNSADTITLASGGFDYANGKDGNDKITKTDSGHTMMLGGAGSDTMTLTTTARGTYLNGWVHGEQGNDIIRVSPYTRGGNYFAEVFGGSGAGSLWASDMDAVLNGGSGNDNIQAIEGRYTIHGDGNDDTIRVTGDGIATAYGDSGNDNMIAHMGSITSYGGTGNDIFTSGADSFNTFYGEAGADKFLCGDGHDAVMDYNPSEGDTVSSACEIVSFAVSSLVR